MTPWTEINLPFSCPMETDVRKHPPIPDWAPHERVRFGYSYSELSQTLDHNLWESLYNQVYNRTPMRDENYAEFFGRIRDKTLNEMKEIDPEQARLHQLMIEMTAWHNGERRSLPEFLEYDRACADAQTHNQSLTFHGRGLSKPGTQIETENGGRYLIGNIALRGGYGESPSIDPKTIVSRYRVLIADENLL